MKLSKAQTYCCLQAKAHGGRLVLYTSSGIWSAPGVTIENGKPQWFVQWSTVKSLVEQGIFRVIQRMPPRPGVRYESAMEVELADDLADLECGRISGS